MKPKHFIITWFTVFIVVFALNGAFHSGIAASFFDTNLSSIQSIKKMKDSNPLPVALLDFIIVFGMTYLITRNFAGKIKLSDAAITGGLINLISSGAWNLANAAMFNWPATVIIGDIAWHVTLGATGGILIAVICNRIYKNKAVEAY